MAHPGATPGTAVAQHQKTEMDLVVPGVRAEGQLRLIDLPTVTWPILPAHPLCNGVAYLTGIVVPLNQLHQRLRRGQGA